MGILPIGLTCVEFLGKRVAPSVLIIFFINQMATSMTNTSDILNYLNIAVEKRPTAMFEENMLMANSLSVFTADELQRVWPQFEVKLSFTR